MDKIDGPPFSGRPPWWRPFARRRWLRRLNAHLTRELLAAPAARERLLRAVFSGRDPVVDR